MVKKVEVFDPPMCCSTGICGPSVDPALVQFAADFHWLADQGVQIERYNLAQQPQAYAASETVKAALTKFGNECLPLILVDGAIVRRGSYPTRKELAGLAGLQGEEAPSLYSAAVAELVAIGDLDCVELRALFQVPLRQSAQARGFRRGHGSRR